MAGSFGYEAEHYEVSMEVGRDRLFPAIEAEGADTVVAATGTSCREQIFHGTERARLAPGRARRAGADVGAGRPRSGR